MYRTASFLYADLVSLISGIETRRDRVLRPSFR